MGTPCGNSDNVPSNDWKVVTRKQKGKGKGKVDSKPPEQPAASKSAGKGKPVRTVFAAPVKGFGKQKPVSHSKPAVESFWKVRSSDWNDVQVCHGRLLFESSRQG